MIFLIKMITCYLHVTPHITSLKLVISNIFMKNVFKIKKMCITNITAIHHTCRLYSNKSHEKSLTSFSMVTSRHAWIIRNGVSILTNWQVSLFIESLMNWFSFKHCHHRNIIEQLLVPHNDEQIKLNPCIKYIHHWANLHKTSISDSGNIWLALLCSGSLSIQYKLNLIDEPKNNNLIVQWFFNLIPNSNTRNTIFAWQSVWNNQITHIV